jgi:hypothetical protein
MTGGMGFRIKLHSSKREARMSALGQKQTFPGQAPMSALPLKADIDLHAANVRLSPKASQAHREVCFVPQFVH